MSALLRSVLILLLVLLPLRSWAQLSMSAADFQGPAVASAPAANAHAMMAMDDCPAQTHAGCQDHPHTLCSICQLAVGQPAAFVLRLTHAAPHACPLAADLAWNDADPRQIQRPPRV
ncbi:hypothetical protein [Thiomonas sp.]